MKTVELSPEQIAAIRKHLQEIFSSAAFLGCHRAQDFLRLVVEHALAGQLDCLRERMLGAELFGRPIDYDTGNDSVVRVKASEVRRRLTQYYQSVPSPPAVQIKLPAGSYAPHFHWAPSEAPSPIVEPASSVLVAADIQAPPEIARGEESETPQRKGNPWVFRALMLTAYSAILIAITWFVSVRFSAPHRVPKATDPIWAAIFDGKRNTYIVPADVGFNLLEDLSHHPMVLTDYMKGGYLDLSLPEMNEESAQGLRSQRLTSFVDAQTIATLMGLPEYNPQRTFLRFPRDLRLDDLKSANAVLIGSIGSNPWAAVGDSSANFHIVYHQGMGGATVVNDHPKPGEQTSYESHWNKPAHETFALISFLPNLDANGHLLLIQGLDVAGTQAAAEALLSDLAALDPILHSATRPDGSMRYFEMLVRSTSINWNSTDSQVIAVRIY